MRIENTKILLGQIADALEIEPGELLRPSGRKG
jgi:hypothetical protein